MSATNQTSNYGFPLFESDDKPTWQGDFNSAMSGIDGAISGVNAKSVNHTIPVNEVNVFSQSWGIISDNANINYNGSIFSLHGYFSLQTVEHSTVVGYNYYTELFSVNRNIFGLPVSTISSQDNRYNFGNYWGVNIARNKLIPVTLYAYWNGTNTIFYTSHSTSEDRFMVIIDRTFLGSIATP